MNNSPTDLGTIGKTDKEVRQEIIKIVKELMGDGKIQIELTPRQWETCLDKALTRYRLRSANATEESHMFMEIQPEQTTYTLPKEVTEVIKLYRRGVGGTTTGGGTYLDPFALAYNNLYLLQIGGQGGLATFHMYADYQETIGRLFGQQIDFIWNTNNKKLTIIRRFLHPETIVIRTHNFVPDAVLLEDYKARDWLIDYTMATAMKVLSQIRGKFVTLPGPQGGIQLNAQDLASRADAEFQRLEEEIKNFVDSDLGMPFVIG